MACYLRHLPGRQAGVDVFGELLALLRQAVDLVGDIDGRLALHISQLVDLGLKFGNGLLELQEVSFAHPMSSQRWRGLDNMLCY